MEPRQLHERLIQPALCTDIVEKVGNISLRHDSKPKKHRHDSESNSTGPRARPGDDVNGPDALGAEVPVAADRADATPAIRSLPVTGIQALDFRDLHVSEKRPAPNQLVAKKWAIRAS